MALANITNNILTDTGVNVSSLTPTSTTISTTAPLQGGGDLSANRTLSITQAGASANGYLSSTDWNTFNNKQASGDYITSLTGEATGVGPGATAVTLNNASVTSKLLTGVNITGGTVLATDTMLTAFGKLQNQINGLVGSTIYQGVWNANTNTPTLTSSVGTKGYYYIVNVAGATNLNGITDWKIGDWAIFDGTAWQKVDNTESVSSVNGFTGAVSLTTDNIAQGTTNLYFSNALARGAISATAPIGYNNTTGVISITQASASANGYLSSTDWNTFNNKQVAGNYVTTDTTQSISGLKTFTSVITSTISAGDSIVLNKPTGPQITFNKTNATAQSWAIAADPNFRIINSTLSNDALLFNFATNSALFNSSVTSTSFIKTGGTSSQFLKADGTVDSSTYLTTSSAALTYLALAGGVMTGQIVLAAGTTSTDYTKGLRFPNDPYGGSGDTSGLRLYAETTTGVEAQVLELYVTNDGAGGSQDRINFYAPSNDLVTINGNKIWNAGNLTPQSAITLTTTGTSGAATLVGATLNIPQYQSVLTNPVTGTGSANRISKFTGASTIGDSIIYDNTSNISVGSASNTRSALTTNGQFFSYYSTEASPRVEINRDLLGGGLSGIGFTDRDATFATWGVAVGLSAARELGFFVSNGTSLVKQAYIVSTGAATFSSSVTAASFAVGQMILNSNQLYRSSADEMYLNYSGTGHTILGNSTGNVSINAGTNPGYKLTVVGVTDIQAVRVPQLTLLRLSTTTLSSDVNDEISIDIGRGGLSKYSGRISGYISNFSTYDGGLKFYTSTSGTLNTNPSLTLSPTGFVGINNTNPQARLDLGTGYGASGEKFLIYNDNNTNALSGTKVGFYMDRFGLSNNSTFVFPTASAAPGSFIISSKDTSGTTLVALVTVLGQGGNMGIGNTSPLTKLHVNNSVSGAILPYINGTGLSYNNEGISVAGSNTNNTNIGNGITFYNNVSAVGTYGPVVAWSSQTVGGAYNSTYAFITGVYGGAGGDNNWAVGSIIFGTANSYGAQERMRLSRVGFLGIGSTDPTAPLHVNDGSYNRFTVRVASAAANIANAYGGIGFSGEEANTKGAIFFQSIGASYARGNMLFCLNNAQDQSNAQPSDAVLTLFTNTRNATFVGSVTATGFFESSDSRLKKLIKDDYKVLGIEAIKPKLYIKNGKEEVGYFAQDIQNILSTAVSINDEGYLNLSYTQVHTAKIAIIEDEVDILKKEVAELKVKLQKYES